MFLPNIVIRLCMMIHFCRYSLLAFIRVETLKGHFIDCFKSNGKQMIKTLKKVEYFRFKN